MHFIKTKMGHFTVDMKRGDTLVRIRYSPVVNEYQYQRARREYVEHATGVSTVTIRRTSRE